MAISSPSRSDAAIRRAVQQLAPGAWDFADADTKDWTHGYHSYPAMMIPPVARSLIALIQHHQPAIRTLFDPFMGSGTSLVEGLLAGLSVHGSDLNPLSRLITQAKTTAWDPERLEALAQHVFMTAEYATVTPDDWPDFDHLTFWFKPRVIDDLVRIKRAIHTVVPPSWQPFFWVAFSDTVRWVSNSRHAEFKLYRLDPARLARWNPDVLETFAKIVQRNQIGNAALDARRPLPSVTLYGHNAMHLADIADETFDLMVTSPPYGDSRTTVAYGQFSRLSLQWLDLSEADNAPPVNKLDQALLGGVAVPQLDHALPSPTLTASLAFIAQQDTGRAREVLAFYRDLDHALKEIARVMRPGSYQCWVVGNRTVKQVQLATDQIITELSAPYGVIPVVHYTRTIPNKRMPRANSPTNRAGATGATMTGEQIVILRKASLHNQSPADFPASIAGFFAWRIACDLIGGRVL